MLHKHNSEESGSSAENGEQLAWLRRKTSRVGLEMVHGHIRDQMMHLESI